MKEWGYIGMKGRVVGSKKNRVCATHIPGQDKEDNQEPLLDKDNKI